MPRLSADDNRCVAAASALSPVSVPTQLRGRGAVPKDRSCPWLGGARIWWQNNLS